MSAIISTFLMEILLNYLNPIRRLGKKKYSTLFPLLVSVVIPVLSELFAVFIAHNPNIVGVYIIWANVMTIMYFAFRDGLKGGVIAALIPVCYYAYIIYTRQHTGAQLVASVETTIVLGLLYLAMAGIIGWLKQTIDSLIESEANEKRRLQAIVQQLPVGVVITDSKGRVTQVNKKLETILGTKIPLGFIMGSAPLLPTTTNGKNIVPSKGPLAQVISTGKTVGGKEFSIKRKDGREVYVLTSAAPIHNKVGKLIAAASISYDITQQKELEKRKDDFLNMASHELRTPLTSMKLYIDSLTAKVRDYDDERVNKTIKSIKQQTDRLQELVSDLLDVSKIQTGKLSFVKETFRLDTLAAETIEDVRGMAKKQEIVLTSKASVNVFADRFRMYQVLTNLITNAIKYSKGEKQIKVRIKREADKVVVSVQDFGIGIAKEQQKKIFERLYQVQDDNGRTYPGFGMGLYISKEIITRHKGAIWVESEKGKGSTFYFTLPLKK